MILCCNTSPLARYSEETALKLLKEAGFDAADLSLFCMSRPGNRWEGENYKEQAVQLGKYARELGIPFVQAHAPFQFDKTADFYTVAFPTIYRAVEIAALAGAKFIVVHPYQAMEYFGNEEKLFAFNMDFYSRLKPLCEQYRVQVCVENMWKRHKYRRCIDHSACSRPAEFNRYVDTLNADGKGHFCACLDIGHTVLVGEDPVAMIHAMGSRIGTLHIHDNDYFQDSHTLPGLGKMDMENTFKALKEIGYSGPFTLEADNFVAGLPDVLVPAALNFMAENARYYSSILTCK